MNDMAMVDCYNICPSVCYPDWDESNPKSQLKNDCYDFEVNTGSQLGVGSFSSGGSQLEAEEALGYVNFEKK